MIIICVVISAIYILLHNKYIVSNNSYYGYSLYSDYVIGNIGSNENIIKQYFDLQEFCSKFKKSEILDTLLTKYNDNFFENQFLAIKYRGLPSGSMNVKFVNAIKFENIVNIKYKVNNPRVGTDDLSGYLIIVEIDKDINDIIWNEQIVNTK